MLTPRRLAVFLVLLVIPLSPSALAVASAHNAKRPAAAARHHRARKKHQKHYIKSSQKGNRRHVVKRRHAISHIGKKKKTIASISPFGALLGTTTMLVGESGVQSHTSSLSAGHAEAMRFQSVASGLAGAARLYLDRANTARVVVFGIYSDKSGRPSTLLGTGTLASPVAGTWNSIPLASMSVSAGGYYWLAVLGEGGTLRYRARQRSACPSVASAQRSLLSLPSQWTTGNRGQECPLSAYVVAVEPPSVESQPLTPSEPVVEESAPSLPSKEEPASEPSPPVAPPVVVSVPVVSGSAVEGQVLSASAGVWSGSPTGYGYQWQDCDGSGGACVSIAGATASSYQLTAADVEHTVRVVVTASNAGGSTQAGSAVTGVVVAPLPTPPVVVSVPVVSGSAVEGQVLSASAGVWSGSPTGYGYQWQDCDGSGGACVSIAGATGSSYKLVAADVEHTVRVVVTASNAGGSTQAGSAATGVVAAVVVNSGCTTTIGSGLATAIKNAAAGSTICLTAGNYGEVNVTVSKSSMVTIKPASGVSQSQVVLGYVNVNTSSNLTFEGATIAGGSNGSSSTPATHIHWVGDAFTSGLCIMAPTSANIDVLVEGSTFFGIGEGRGGCGNEGRIEVNGENKGPSGTNGVVISGSSFGRNGCTDGVNITGGASGTVIGPDDVFENMKEGSCKAHVDPIQFYGAESTTITDDYFHGNSTGIMSPDGNGSPMTVTGCVFDTDGEYPDQIVIGGGEHDVISHDTFGHGARVRIGHVNVGATASNEKVVNNVITGGLELTEGQSSSGWTMEYNLVEGEVLGAHSIKGRPTYTGGGTEPSTWSGWQLASGSLGYLGASDGSSMGAGYFD